MLCGIAVQQEGVGYLYSRRNVTKYCVVKLYNKRNGTKFCVVMFCAAVQQEGCGLTLRGIAVQQGARI